MANSAFNPFDVFENDAYTNRCLVETVTNSLADECSGVRNIIWDTSFYWNNNDETIPQLKKLDERINHLADIARSCSYFLERLIACYENRSEDEED